MNKENLINNLKTALAAETQKNLGDRSKYIGASDIGSCPRKVFLSKKSGNEIYTAETLVRFQRGHIAESIAEKMLGDTYESQKEVKRGNIKAHIDFYNETKAHIVEVKSVQGALKEPLESWMIQVQLQLALLNNPNATADIIAIDVNSGWFDIFEIAQDEQIQKDAMAKAEFLLNAIENNIEPEPKETFYCNTCPFKTSCSLMSNGIKKISADIAQIAIECANTNAQIKELEKGLESKKELLKDTLNTLGVKKIQAGSSFISVITRKSNISIDTNAFKKAEPEKYNEIVNLYCKSNNETSFLKFS